MLLSFYRLSFCRLIMLSSYRVDDLPSYLRSFYRLVPSITLPSHPHTNRFFFFNGFILPSPYHLVVSGWRWWGYHANSAVPGAPASVHTEAQPQDSSGERRKLCLRQLQGLAARVGFRPPYAIVREEGRGVAAPLGTSSESKWLIEPLM